MLRIRHAFHWLCAAAVVVVICLCCWQCLDIYLTGTESSAVSDGSIYSVSDVITRLQKWLPLLMICLSVICLACVFGAHKDTNFANTLSSYEYQLRLLKSCSQGIPEAAVREESFRKRVRLIRGILCASCFIVCLVYLLNPDHFLSWNLEGVIGDMLQALIPWLILGFSTFTLATVFCQRSIEREIQLLRKSPRISKQPSPTASAHEQHGIIRMLLYILAVVLILLGIMNGGLYDVFVKAINICTECIGLG